MKVRHFKNLIKYRLAFFVAFPFLIQACSTMQVVESDISMEDQPDFGLLLMAHGGTEEWNEAVLQATAEVTSKYPVEVAFGMADAGSLERSVRRLEKLGVKDVGLSGCLSLEKVGMRERNKYLGRLKVHLKKTLVKIRQAHLCQWGFGR